MRSTNRNYAKDRHAHPFPQNLAAAVVSLLALSGLLGAAIYALAGEEVQDGCGGIGGVNF